MKCRNKIPLGDLEAVFREQLTHFLIAPNEIAAHNAAADEALREKEALVASVETELRKIEVEDDRLYQLYLADGLSKEDFGRRHRPLSERRKQLEDELPKLQAQCDLVRIGKFSREEALGEARDLADRWTDLAFEDRRQIVEAITERIVVGEEDVEITLLNVGTTGEIGADKGTLAPPFMGLRSARKAQRTWPSSSRK